MKRIFTSLLLLATVGLSTQAQTLTFEPAKEISHSLSTWDIEELFVDIGLEETADVTFAWTLIENTLPEEWSYSLCDVGHCYIGIPEKATMDPLTKKQMDDGELGFFKITIIAGEEAGKENYGKGRARLYVYDVNNMEGGDTVTFDVDFTAPNSVIKVSKTGLKVYPNPNNGNFTIVPSSPQAFTYTLSAVNGQVVASGNTATVKLEGITRGIYFLQVIQEDGTRLTQKVLVN